MNFSCFYRLDPLYTLAFRFYRGSPFSFLDSSSLQMGFELVRRLGERYRGEERFPPGGWTKRRINGYMADDEGRLGDPRMPAVKIIRRGAWIIVSNLVASLKCSSNFFVKSSIVLRSRKREIRFHF